MSDGGDKKPIPLTSLMRQASVPMPASPLAPGGAGGGGGGGNVFSRMRGEPVGHSRDLERILTLPRRDPVDLNSPRADAMIQLITERYSNGRPAGQGCRCQEIDPRRFLGGTNGCITSVLPVQAWAMYEMGLAGGCIGSIVVGGGKTILNILGIYALDVDKALALIPSNLLGQFWDDYELLEQHFQVPSVYIEGGRGRKQSGQPELRVLPYSLLSRPGRSAYIDDFNPEAIICDEIDKLSDIRGSATARRVLRYYVEAEAKSRTVKFAGWTGSITNKRISEYSHLVVMALKENAPVPHDPVQVTAWGTAIDVTEQPAPMGALRALCSPEDFVYAKGDDTKAVRRAFGRRLADTLGIITTSENEVEVSDEKGTIKGSRVEVVVRERVAPPLPDVIVTALDYARGFIRPDKELGFSPQNEELESPVERARVVAEIASGVMNVWEFPPTNAERTKFVKNGVPQENAVIDYWYTVRAEWNKSVRAQCIAGLQHFDSPKLCEEAAARFYEDLPKKPGYPEWDNPIWPEWKKVRKTVKPMPVSKRIHPFVVEDALRWGEEHKGVIWYALVEFGKWVAELSGFPLHTGGPKAGAKIKAERGERSILASIESHGRGRNGLQFLFANQLVAQIPASAKRWEQLLGRLIRRGTRFNEVTTWLYLHVPELRDAVGQALKASEYVEDTWRTKLKLLHGWQNHMEENE